MGEKKMLKEDMDAMSYEEALDLLRFDLDMRTFDPMTGEVDSLFRLKNSGNKDNYRVYVAISKCIEYIETVINNTKKIREAFGLDKVNLGDDLDNPSSIDMVKFKADFDRYINRTKDSEGK